MISLIDPAFYGDPPHLQGCVYNLLSDRSAFTRLLVFRVRRLLATQFNSFKPDVLPNTLLFTTLPATKGGNLIQLRIDASVPRLGL